MAFRVEKDAFGEVRVPANRLWGAQTQRSFDNFKISDHERMPPDLIKSMGIVKLAAARVNAGMGKLPDDLSNAIITAAQEVVDGTHADEFPLVVWYVIRESSCEIVACSETRPKIVCI